MKIYLASSWKNKNIVFLWKQELQEKGHEVDAFVDSSDGRYVFHYSEIDNIENLDVINFLEDNRTKKAFQEDKKWLDWCDCCLLILPSGKSSHLEAGYAKGKGKIFIVWEAYFPKGKFDVMYGFADLITDSLTAVTDFLEKKKIT
jgi:hypothetical protein